MIRTKISFTRSKWTLLLGIFIIAGCKVGSSTGPDDGGGDIPPNQVFFTLTGTNADALLEFDKNGNPGFSETHSPPWTSTILRARRNDSFTMRICDSGGDLFSMHMFLNGDEISSFSHQSSDIQNQCSEKTVILDDTYDNLLLD